MHKYTVLFQHLVCTNINHHRWVRVAATCSSNVYMWQSHVEIEGYSVMYFDHIATFKVLYRWTSVKGGAHTHFMDSLDVHAFMNRVWAPPLMEVQQYDTSNAAMQSKYTME